MTYANIVSTLALLVAIWVWARILAFDPDAWRDKVRLLEERIDRCRAQADDQYDRERKRFHAIIEYLNVNMEVRPETESTYVLVKRKK